MADWRVWAWPTICSRQPTPWSQGSAALLCNPATLDRDQIRRYSPAMDDHDPSSPTATTPTPPRRRPIRRSRCARPSTEWHLTPDVLRRLPHLNIPECYIVSTGHGTSGRFHVWRRAPAGALQVYAHESDWTQVEVVSATALAPGLAAPTWAVNRPPVAAAGNRD